jgi:DNA segregation ATPase FtsK/SpoIIIE, S-DNA-T family
MTDQQLDTHYEAILDEEPEPTRDPVYVDVVSRTHDRQPIIPAGWRGWINIKASLRRNLHLHLYRTGYHGPRLFLVYIPLSCWYAIIGVLRLIRKQIGWWWVLEQHQVRQEAANANDPHTWAKLHAIALATRRWRAYVLAGELVAVTTIVLLLALAAPLWAGVLVGMVTVPMLAHYGRPIDKPILSPAVVTNRFRVITADVVLRAYYAAKLGRPDRDDQVIRFASRMERDGGGGRVKVDLPHGTSWADMIKPGTKSSLASGLDVSVNQLFLTPDKSSARRHELFVADVDPLAIPAGRTPMLNCKPTSIWQPAPFGLDERGKKVNVPLMWNSILVGAQPRKGKTFSARLLALHAALDPLVTLVVVDGKNSPDWKDFRLVAHRYVSGTHPNPLCADPVEELLAALYEVKRHIQDVNAALTKLDASQCPEGKITPELGRKYPLLRPWVLMMEEFQLYYELDDQDSNKEIAGLLSTIVAVGPSAGVTLLSSSQKPSGIGSGDVQRLFNRYRDNHAGRFALKCGNRIVSDAILGGDAYSEGYDAASLPNGPEYRGVGYLYGLADETPTVRCHLATGEDVQKILVAARKHRENAGTLTGAAAGEDVARDLRDVLHDVDGVFYAGEAWISWPQLATRLADRIPEHYAGTTAEAISAQVRGLGVAPKKGRDEFADGKSLWGVPREQVQQARQKREIGGRA